MSYSPKSGRGLKGSLKFKASHSGRSLNKKPVRVNPDVESGVKTSRVNRGKVGLKRGG